MYNALFYTVIITVFAIMIIRRKINQIQMELEYIKSKHFFTSNNLYNMQQNVKGIYHDIDILQKEQMQNDKQIDILHKQIYNMKNIIGTLAHDING